MHFQIYKNQMLIIMINILNFLSLTHFRFFQYFSQRIITTYSFYRNTFYYSLIEICSIAVAHFKLIFTIIIIYSHLTVYG